MGIQKIAKINSGNVRKRFAVAVGSNIFSPNVIPEISSRGSIPAKNMRGQGHGFPPTIRGNDKRGQPCPELGRRVVSLYQDKEVTIERIFSSAELLKVNPDS